MSEHSKKKPLDVKALAAEILRDATSGAAASRAVSLGRKAEG